MKGNIKKKIISAITAVSVIAALSSGCVIAKNNTETAAADTITVTYDGSEIEFDVQPEIINDRVMVPMRAIFEAFGAKVKWDSDTQTITSKKKSKTITMTIGSADMTKNDETYTFDTAPVIEDGRTLVPIRAISEMLGLDVEWEEDTQTVVIVTPEDGNDNGWKENTGAIDLSTLKTTGDGVSVAGSVITITEGGDFEVTGTLDDGQIVIDTEDKVKLRLSGMSLTNKSGSAIYIKNADKAYITLTDGTENTLTDGEEYTSGDEKEKAVITARDNLEIKGKGSLTINANYKNGIDGSDSVEIENGDITINAVNDGIHANDTLAVSGGTLTVTAESDSLQADEIVDITGGTINITTTGDVPTSTNNDFGFGGFGRGMQQETTATAEDTTDDVTSKGIKADWLLDISGGTINLTTTDHAIHGASDIIISGGEITISSDNKGISAHGDITIDNGTINITKSTEGIESKQILTVNGGDISVVASDDGFNAGGNGNDMFGGGPMGGERNWQNGENSDNAISGENNGGQQSFGGRGMRGQGGIGADRPQGGMVIPDMQNGEMMLPEGMEGMTPPEMPEGMEGGFGGPMGGRGGMGADRPQGDVAIPDMQNGEMMTPPDMNGDNAQQGGGRGGFGGFGNRDSSEVSTEHHIQINGGTIYIEAQADGIDSNGTIRIDGGTVTVNAQVTGAESAFDADSAILFNGGTIVGISGAGLDESPNSYSNQNVIIAYTTSTLSAGDKVKLTDSNGKTIIEETAAIGGGKIVISTPDIKTGETYTITAGSETLSATVEDIITSAGTKSSGMDGFGGGRGGMGGRGMQAQTTKQ